MRKSLLFIVLLLPALASAITQQGFVRTISRPNYTPQRLDGVLIRIRGNHNPVLSTETGDFAILLHDLQNGDPYALSAVMKSGYQLSEQDLIGRQQAGSERVPLELTMVSTAQLQAEKNAIAAKAREGVEHYYLEQLTTIETALAEQRLTAEQYEQQIAALDDKLMRSEEQIMAMADRYARTDYALLDSVAGAIQTAIEGGDIDAAEEMIRRKGSLQDRRQRLLDMQRDIAAQTQDLKADYYHLHSIALSRFLPDTAAMYLRLRADQDTTDAAAQLDYAQFLNEYQRDAAEAYTYVLRAERQMLSTNNEHSRQMLSVLNETAVYYQRTQRLPEATAAMRNAVTLATELYTHDHKYVAGRLVNLGAIYYRQSKYSEAKKHLEEAIHIYHLPEQGDSIAEAQALNNLAGIAAAKKDWSSTRTYLEQALTLMQAAAPNNNSLPTIAYNLGNVCLALGDQNAAHAHYQFAYESAKRILGENAPLTQSIQKKL